MAAQWVDTHRALLDVDCSRVGDNGWTQVMAQAWRLKELAQFRGDPQADNLQGLYQHSSRMITASGRFCELGLTTANARMAAARTAWERR